MPTMTVALDARGTQTGHATRGIGRVIRELVDAIARLPAEQRAPFVVVGDGRPNAALKNEAAVARTIGGILSPGAMGHHDLVVRLAPSAPQRGGCPQLVVCHDLIQLKAAREHFPLHRRLRYPMHWFAFQLSLDTIRRAERVWTVSRAVADDAHRLLGTERSRLSPIPLAPSSTLRVPSPAARREILLKHELTGPYLLWLLGGANENKNVPGMLRVMANGGLPPLVIVGAGTAASRARIRRRARRLGAGDPSFLGYVPDDELGAVIHDAHAVVVPSTDEGFGLPVVEGLKCGGSVVANDIAVLREIGGNSVRFADINDPARFAEALRQPRLAAEPGALRTWDDVARDVVDLILAM